MMNRLFNHIRLLTAMLAAATAFAACNSDKTVDDNDDNGGSQTATLTVTGDSSNIDHNGGIIVLTVEAPADWTAKPVTSDGGGWAALDKNSGKAGKSTVTLTITGNTSSEARSVQVRFSCNGKSQIYTVEQSGMPHPDEVRITHTATEFSLPTLNDGQSASGTVYWGDGSSSEIEASATHRYDSQEAGKEHTVTIQWTPTVSFKLNDLSGVTSIDLSGLY